MINVRRSINEHEVKHSSNGFIIKSSDGGRGKRKGRETGDRLCKVTRIRFREPGFEKEKKKKKDKKFASIRKASIRETVGNCKWLLRLIEDEDSFFVPLPPPPHSAAAVTIIIHLISVDLHYI